MAGQGLRILHADRRRGSSAKVTAGGVGHSLHQRFGVDLRENAAAKQAQSEGHAVWAVTSEILQYLCRRTHWGEPKEEVGGLKDQLLHADQKDSGARAGAASDITESQFFAGIADRIAAQAFIALSAKLASINEPLVYSIEQAAGKLGLSRTTLKTMIREREIAVVRRGTRVLVPRKSLEDWIDRNIT